MALKAITTRTPTYLQALLEPECSLKLVYKERLLVKKEEEEKAVIEDDLHQDCTIVSELDLTGDPLKVDLGGNDTICSDIVLEKPANWTLAEAQQYPLTLTEARSYINNQLMLGKPNESLYCICDGEDVHKQVGLGTVVIPHKITRIIVNILPCCDENDEITSITHLQKEHIKNVRSDANVKVAMKKTYNLFGYNLKNCTSFGNAEFNGNISLETMSRGYKAPDFVQMKFQVVKGHTNSSVSSFWEELCLLESYINIFETMKLDEFVIINSKDCVDVSELETRINDFTTRIVGFKMPSYEKLDLKNFRDKDILDMLWDTLKHCETLSDLRNLLHLFFENLAESREKLQRLSEVSSAIAETVNGILDGVIAVPTLTLPQSLEILIELGLEKLKNDYLIIISRFYTIAYESIVKTWSGLQGEVATVNKSTRRKSRISTKLVTTDMSVNKLKLAFLDSCHTATEFIFLFKENLPLLEECFDCFLSTVCNKFLNKFDSIIRHDFKQLHLCEILFSISPRDIDLFIKDKSPVAFSVKMVTTGVSWEICTVYYFSEFPIFPPSIYENYDINGDMINTKSYYVAKLLKVIYNC